MPAMDTLLVAIVLTYALVQAALLIAWAVHIYRVQVGLAGLFAPRWSLVDVWVGMHLALLLTLAILLYLGVVAGATAAVFAPQKIPQVSHFFDRQAGDASLFWLVLIPALVLQNVAFAAIALVYVMGKYRMNAETLGFRWDWRSARRGVLWGVLAFVLTPVVEWLNVGLLRLVLGVSTFERMVSWEKQNVAIEQVFEMLQPGVGTLIFLLLVAVAAPLGEEVFFRGFVFNVLRHRLGLGVGLWLSSLLFALLHVSVRNFLPILLIGLLLAWIYLRTGSLWSSVFMHAVFNFCSATFAILVGIH